MCFLNAQAVFEDQQCLANKFTEKGDKFFYKSTDPTTKKKHQKLTKKENNNNKKQPK